MISLIPNVSAVLKHENLANDDFYFIVVRSRVTPHTTALHTSHQQNFSSKWNACFYYLICSTTQLPTEILGHINDAFAIAIVYSFRWHNLYSMIYVFASWYTVFVYRLRPSRGYRLIIRLFF